MGSAGDFNGDGFDDLLVTAPIASGSIALSGGAKTIFSLDRSQVFLLRLILLPSIPAKAFGLMAPAIMIASAIARAALAM